MIMCLLLWGALPLLTPAGIAQAPAPRPEQTAPDIAETPIPDKRIDAALRAHVLSYFGDKKVRRSALEIKSLNGKRFDDLTHSVKLLFGAVAYWNGNAIPQKGSELLVTFQRGALAVKGTATGDGGIAKISLLTIGEGTRVVLRSGDSYQYRKGAWVSVEPTGKP
jgi:hypothetical protein